MNYLSFDCLLTGHTRRCYRGNNRPWTRLRAVKRNIRHLRHKGANDGVSPAHYILSWSTQ